MTNVLSMGALREIKAEGVPVVGEFLLQIEQSGTDAERLTLTSGGRRWVGERNRRHFATRQWLLRVGCRGFIALMLPDANPPALPIERLRQNARAAVCQGRRSGSLEQGEARQLYVRLLALSAEEPNAAIEELRDCGLFDVLGERAVDVVMESVEIDPDVGRLTAIFNALIDVVKD